MNFVASIKNRSLCSKNRLLFSNLIILALFSGIWKNQIKGQDILNLPASDGTMSIWMDSPGQLYQHPNSGIGVKIHARFEINPDLAVWKGFYVHTVGMGCLRGAELIFFLENNAQVHLKSPEDGPCDEWTRFDFDRYEAIALLKLEVESVLLVSKETGAVWADSPTDPAYWMKMGKGLKKVNNTRRHRNK